VSFYQNAQVNVISDRNVGASSVTRQEEVQYPPDPSEGDSYTSEEITDVEDVEDPSGEIINAISSEIPATELPPLSRTGRHLAPPTSHNRSRLFATLTMKRPHGQTSKYRCFAWRFEGEIPEQVVHPITIGKLDEMRCEYCGAVYFWLESAKSDEGYRTCCMRGQIKRPPFEEPGNPVLNLFTGNSVRSKHFQTNIRTYNTLMSFGNTIAKWKNPGGPGRRSPWALTVNGQISRIMNWGMPDSEGHVDRGDQLYFLDNLEEAVEARIRRAERSFQEKPLPEVLTILEEYLRGKNPYAASFRILNEVLRSRRTSDNAQTTNIILAINPVPADMGWRKRRVPHSER